MVKGRGEKLKSEQIPSVDRAWGAQTLLYSVSGQKLVPSCPLSLLWCCAVTGQEAF